MKRQWLIKLKYVWLAINFQKTMQWKVGLKSCLLLLCAVTKRSRKFSNFIRSFTCNPLILKLKIISRDFLGIFVEKIPFNTKVNHNRLHFSIAILGRGRDERHKNILYSFELNPFSLFAFVGIFYIILKWNSSTSSSTCRKLLVVRSGWSSFYACIILNKKISLFNYRLRMQWACETMPFQYGAI